MPRRQSFIGVTGYQPKKVIALTDFILSINNRLYFWAIRNIRLNKSYMWVSFEGGGRLDFLVPPSSCGCNLWLEARRSRQGAKPRSGAGHRHFSMKRKGWLLPESTEFVILRLHISLINQLLCLHSRVSLEDSLGTAASIYGPRRLQLDRATPGSVERPAPL